MKKILALALACMMVLALAACGGSAPAEAPAEAPAQAPAAEAPAPAAEAPAPAAEAPAGDASGEMGEGSDEPSSEPSGEPMPASGDIEITVNGVTGVASYEESDNGDMATKGLVVYWDGQSYTGMIDKGVYTADDAAAQPIFDALQAARSAAGTGEPSAEPAA